MEHLSVSVFFSVWDFAHLQIATTKRCCLRWKLSFLVCFWIVVLHAMFKGKWNRFCQFGRTQNFSRRFPIRAREHVVWHPPSSIPWNKTQKNCNHRNSAVFYQQSLQEKLDWGRHLWVHFVAFSNHFFPCTCIKSRLHRLQWVMFRNFSS